MTNASATNTSDFDSATQRFRYRVGYVLLLIGAACVFGLLYGYEDITDPNLRVHLFSKHLPFVIPHEAIVAGWWIMFVSCLLLVLMGAMPAVSIILSENEISAQSLLTRKFTTIAYRDILGTAFDKNYIEIVDKHGKKISLSRAGLSRSDFRTITDKIASSAGHAR